MTDVEQFKQQHLTIPCMLPLVDKVSAATCEHNRKRTCLFRAMRNHISRVETVECSDLCPNFKPEPVSGLMEARFAKYGRLRDMERDMRVCELYKAGYTPGEIAADLLLKKGMVASILHRNNMYDMPEPGTTCHERYAAKKTKYAITCPICGDVFYKSRGRSGRHSKKDCPKPECAARWEEIEHEQQRGYHAE